MTRNGTCACGAVTWRVMSDSDPAAAGGAIPNLICHCDSCRRATSAAYAAFVGLAPQEVVFSGDIRDYASSPEATRGFCPSCGTRLSFQSTRWPGQIHLHVGTMVDAGD